MKNLLLLAFLLTSTASFSQQDPIYFGYDSEGNRVLRTTDESELPPSGRVTPVQVPTTTEWSLAVMVLGVAGIGVVMLWRKKLQEV